jgi:D-3-phosphoglycerate dehydrogenase / 2-oxoglutarate reductase
MKRKVMMVDVMSGGKPLDMTEEKAALAGLDAEFLTADCTTEDDVLAAAADVDVILTSHAPLSRRVIEKLPKLIAIVRYGVGYDTVDLDAATDRQVVVINIPDFCYEEVSNHAIALLLVCAKKLTIMNNLMKKGDWNSAKQMQEPMSSIWGQTLGIIGCGNIGRTTARKAQVFSLKLIGCDPYADKAVVKAAGIELVSLPDLLKSSDYVTLHTDLNKTSFHLMGEKEFKQMKPSAYLINTSRGKVVDEPALIKALQEKRIAGAGLDVFEKEPMDKANPLLKMDNVVVMPHSASYSDAAFVRLHKSVGQEAARVLAGKKPKNIVNKAVEPRVKLA